MSRGIIIAAPASGSGKTTITLSLLRLLRRLGYTPHSAKVGPDYLDPKFHTAASGNNCFNLDLWAMRPQTFAQVCQQHPDNLLLVEGVMGLFDGATSHEGSTAHIAATTGWPIILVIDAQGMAASVAAIVHGFSTYRSGISVTGVIFNRVGSKRHAQILEESGNAARCSSHWSHPARQRLSATIKTPGTGIG